MSKEKKHKEVGENNVSEESLKQGVFGKKETDTDSVIKDDMKKEKNDEEIQKLNAKVAELTDLIKRTQADFINFKNRSEKEAKMHSEYACFDFAKKLLPVLDSFDMALKNSSDLEKFRKGIEMVHSQLKDVLKHEGLMQIDCLGDRLDPYRHEALMKEKSDKPEDTILEEFQKGYMFKDRVLRHSKVKISG